MTASLRHNNTEVTMNRSAPNVELACKTLLMGVPEVRGSGCNWPCHMMEVVNTCLEIREAKLGRASKKYLDTLRRNLATALERWRVTHERELRALGDYE
jgi:hypothetical protein